MTEPNLIYIFGIIVSLIVEVIKRHFGTNTTATMGALLVTALVGASAYYYVSQTSYFADLVNILVIAGAFYAYLIRNLLPPAIN